MLVKDYKMTSVEAYSFSETGFVHLEDHWKISDGISSYLYPKSKYTRDKAWDAWVNAMM